MALSAVASASDPTSLAHNSSNHATQTTRQQTHYDASKAFGTAVSTWASTIDAALQVCLKSHPQDAAYANLTAATAALKTAADALVTATTT